MDIITEVEKCSLNLERLGKEKDAEDLRHQVTHALLHAPRPESNLTSKQKVGLTFLKKNKDLAVTPFDKGVGFVTLEKKELKLKELKLKRNSKMSPLTPLTPQLLLKEKFKSLSISSIKMANWSMIYTKRSTPLVL
jgi:hypothetical protein